MLGYVLVIFGWCWLRGICLIKVLLIMILIVIIVDVFFRIYLDKGILYLYFMFDFIGYLMLNFYSRDGLYLKNLVIFNIFIFGL